MFGPSYQRNVKNAFWFAIACAAALAGIIGAVIGYFVGR